MRNNMKENGSWNMKSVLRMELWKLRTPIMDI